MKVTADKIVREADVNRILREIEKRATTHTTLTDYYLIALGFATGLRVSEMADLKWTDIDLEGGYLTTVGKGQKKRTVWLGNKTVKLFHKYRQELKRFGVEAEHLFVGRRGPLKRNAIHVRFKYWAKAAGVKNQDISFHSLRHGAATNMLNRGLQLTDVKQQLGHSNISTTSTYLHFTEDSVDRIKRLL